MVVLGWVAIAILDGGGCFIVNIPGAEDQQEDMWYLTSRCFSTEAALTKHAMEEHGLGPEDMVDDTKVPGGAEAQGGGR